MLEKYSPQLRSGNTEGIFNQLNEIAIGKTIKQTQDEERAQEAENGQQTIRKEQVEEAVKGLNQFLEPAYTSIHFKFHEKLNEYYVEVVDRKTDETIREIPSRKILDVYATMLEFVGLLVDERI